jgi:hypothetical protein
MGGDLEERRERGWGGERVHNFLFSVIFNQLLYV